MAEQSDAAGAPEQPAPDLHHFYKPPTMDSMLQIRFVGNTAQVADANFKACDPFQLLVAAAWLERHAKKQLDLAERQAAEAGLAVATLDDPENYGGNRVVLSPGDLRGR